MQAAFLTYRSSQIHYSYGGHGRQLLIGLHGYGESEQSFHFLETHLPSSYQLIAIDLPFHGKTNWQEANDFKVVDLLQIIDQILSARQQPGASFKLIGFSMGGRMSLSIIEVVPQRVEKMILLAPDGLIVNFWYWLATQTWLGNRLFRFTMYHPGWFFGFLQLGNRLQLINPSVYKFTRHYVHDANLRHQLYQRWSGMRRIKPNLAAIRKKIAAHQIPVHLVYGEYDRIILHQRGTTFMKGIENYCTLQVIKAGHQLLQEKYVSLITGLL